jgi:hypothetical protein
MVSRSKVSTKQLDRYIRLLDQESNYIEIILDNKHKAFCSKRLKKALDRKFKKLSESEQCQKLIKLCNHTNENLTVEITEHIKAKFTWYDRDRPILSSLVVTLTS